MRASLRLVASCLPVASLLAIAGCHMDHRYVTPPEGGSTWQVALSEETPPYFSSEDATLYLIEQRIELPVRAPTDEQAAALSVPDELGFGPYPRRPWLERGDTAIEIDVVISNLSDQPQTVSVVLNGINEFHEYVTGVQVDGDDLVIDFAGWERTYALEPFERLPVTIREEELDEVAVDLATVVNGAPNSSQIVFFQNQSAHDPRAQMYIPPIVPGLVGFRLGLRSEGQVRAQLEAVVRARDPGDKLVAVGETPWTLPTPAEFRPVGGV
jgi:hypothetical protein